jgi:starch synthase (maltosyl-transferring)
LTPTRRDRSIGRMSDLPLAGDARRRIVIERVTPEVDGGRFRAKRVLGDRVVVEADVFADGHDVVVAILSHRRAGAHGDTEVRMEPLGNDRWRAAFEVTHLGPYAYTVIGWVDAWETWRRDLRTRVEAGQDVDVDLLIGAELVEAAADRAGGKGQAELADWGLALRGEGTAAARANLALDEDLDSLMRAHPDRSRATTYLPVLELMVEPVRTRFSAWYELFPRSASPEPGRHGTFRDVIARLPYVERLGFDVIYLPPIHPIGTTFRKGPNNRAAAEPGDPGVPWAIGSAEGDHTAIHPELGTLDDLHALVREAGLRGIVVALDLALQASPDHPAVTEHPGWFRHRPDGTIQYAENPPKKYQDIYPFDFDAEDTGGLWRYFEAVVRYWIAQGIRIFRVDNPHTKPFAFWEWLIGRVRNDHPDVFFLSEAFTRPKIMYRLAKLGFSQSYTYFTWRTTKDDIATYFTELNTPPVSDFFVPNVWPNTPDILHATLQTGGRPMFQARLVLAATLAASYGIYGPAFELMEHVPREAGMEEYLDSEKYQVRRWALDRADSLAPLIGQVNRIRHEHPALQSNAGLAFHLMEDDFALAYSKRTADGSDVILVAVSLDPVYPRTSPVHLSAEALGFDVASPFEVEDLLSGEAAIWQGPRVEVTIDPAVCPARIYHVRGPVRAGPTMAGETAPSAASGLASREARTRPPS